MSSTNVVLIAIPAGVALALIGLAIAAVRGKRKLERQLRDDDRTPLR